MQNSYVIFFFWYGLLTYLNTKNSRYKNNSMFIWQDTEKNLANSLLVLVPEIVLGTCLTVYLAKTGRRISFVKRENSEHADEDNKVFVSLLGITCAMFFFLIYP